MKIQSISSNNYSANTKGNPAFKANIYAVTRGCLTDCDWDMPALDKLPITFLREALNSGKIKLENAAIAKIRRITTGTIIRNGIELPKKVEYILMDTTTPEYSQYPPMFDDKAVKKFFEYIKNHPKTEKVPLFIDKNEIHSTASSESLLAFLEELPTLYGVKRENLQKNCNVTKEDILPPILIKDLERKGYNLDLPDNF